MTEKRWKVVRLCLLHVVLKRLARLLGVPVCRCVVLREKTPDA